MTRSELLADLARLGITSRPSTFLERVNAELWGLRMADLEMTERLTRLRVERYAVANERIRLLESQAPT